VRTAISLISFGFTIYKAFEYLSERQPGVAHGIPGPRNFALVMIGLGARFTDPGDRAPAAGPARAGDAARAKATVRGRTCRGFLASSR
jgi:hypothetical protein